MGCLQFFCLNCHNVLITECCMQLFQSSETPDIEHTSLCRLTHANKNNALMQHTINVYTPYKQFITGSYSLFK